MKEPATTKSDKHIEVKLTDSQETLDDKQLTAPTIQIWLISYLAELWKIEKPEINVNINFNRHGLDSAAEIMTGNSNKLVKIQVRSYPSL